MTRGERSEGSDETRGRAAVDAIDHAAALSEILTLLFWASEGIGGSQGAAMARGAMVAQERLEALREALTPNAA